MTRRRSNLTTLAYIIETELRRWDGLDSPEEFHKAIRNISHRLARQIEAYHRRLQRQEQKHVRPRTKPARAGDPC